MLVQAADLAGLYVVQLVHENTAAATMFGIDRLDKDEDLFVLFEISLKTFQLPILHFSDKLAFSFT